MDNSVVASKPTYKGLALLQWNAAGLNTKHVLLKHYLSEADPLPQIICIQETYFNDRYTVQIPGYQLYKRDRGNGKIRGGVATYVHKSVQVLDAEPHRTHYC